MTKKIYEVEGIHCAGCVAAVEKALKQVPGVVSADVNLATEKAQVEMENGEVSFEMLRDEVQKAGYDIIDNEAQSLTFDVLGMHCSGCASAVEKAIDGVPGVESVTVNLTAEKAFVEVQSKSSTIVEQIKEHVKEAGYEIELPQPLESNRSQLEKKRERDREKLEQARRRMLITWLITAPLMVLMFLKMIFGIEIGAGWLTELIMTTGAAVVIFWPGYKTVVSAIKSARVLLPNMDVLIALGTVASLTTGFVAIAYHLGFLESQFYSFSGIAAMIMAFHLTGRYIETKARGRASEAITKLLTLEAKTARVIKNGMEEEIPVEKLKKGDVVLIRPGEKIPADGKVIDGKSSIDESMMTGESVPVLREKGDKVIGGTVNKEGSIRVQVQETGENTFLSQVIRMVEEAQGSKVPIQNVADKITAVFVPVILLLAAITFLGWLLFANQLHPLLVWADPFVPWINTDLGIVSQAFFAALAVLVIACPCALGLATPTALMVGSGLGAENGILIRKGGAIQRLQEVTTFVFDKTGTLTKGELSVVEWTTLAGAEDELKKLIGSVENLSEHPISEAISEYTGVQSSDNVSSFESLTGLGVKGTVNNHTVLAGNKALLEKFSISIIDSVTGISDRFLEKGYTTIFLVVDGEIKGIAGITDTIKESSVRTIQAIHKMGFKTVMLTGDQEKAAQAIAEKLGIENVFAEIRPDQKTEAIQSLQDQGEIVAMVGDGINDAPALSQADVGIALGTGTDIAIESGEIILVDGDTSAVLKALNLSKQTFRKIRQNLFWAFFYNVVMIPVAMIGWMHPVIAEAAMAASSINVVGNSRRLQRKSLS